MGWASLICRAEGEAHFQAVDLPSPLLRDVEDVKKTDARMTCEHCAFAVNEREPLNKLSCTWPIEERKTREIEEKNGAL
ncbi:hypothetical protein MHYP_G00297190 [Metynnis hypsauchen]